MPLQDLVGTDFSVSMSSLHSDDFDETCSYESYGGDVELETGGGSAKGTSRSVATDDNSTVKEMFKFENRWVLAFRVMLIVALIFAAVSVSVAVYFIVRREETDDYETQFADFSLFLVSSFYRSTNAKMWAANMVAVTMTSYGAQAQNSFPNVTLPDWKVITAGPRRLAGDVEAITYSPILRTEEERISWEAYAAETRSSTAAFATGQGGGGGSDYGGGGGGAPPGDITSQMPGDNRLRRMQSMPSMPPDHQNNVFHHGRSIAEGIYRYNGTETIDDEGPAPYVPIWHISPEYNNSASIMYNQASEDGRRDAIEKMINENAEPAYSRVLCNDENLGAPHLHDREPRSLLYYPVLRDWFSFQLAGVITVEFSWTDYFGNNLPEQFDGIVIVLESTEDELYTFRVATGEVTFVGPGDLHDSRFDDMVVQSTFEDFHAQCHYGDEFWFNTYTFGRRNLQEEDNTPLDDEFMNQDALNHTNHYKIRVYPSVDFQTSYITNEPMIFSIAVAIIFIFTSTLFILYDCCVQRRQNRTSDLADRTSAMVDSLFPASVRDRLLLNDDDARSVGSRSRSRRMRRRGSNTFRNNGESKSRGILPEPPKMKLKSFLSGDDTANESVGDQSALSATPPIADLFPHTTIMFADIAGFTAWSSEREPSQVFVLLETLYRNFDMLANRLGVFKVETIGDCYVAVAGLPEPNKDHAVVIARFAWECVLTMSSTCKKLEASLGPGTADLALRVGLHSGPVTAGVLRGEKSRFQLFGDTMNTASRMESNSARNMIQVSQATADHVLAAGKQHWLTPREDKIEAKGKGTMQTYWLRPTRRTGALSNVSSISQSSLSIDMASVSGHDSAEQAPSFPSQRQVISPPRMPRKKNNWGNTTVENTETHRIQSGANISNLIDWNVDVLASSLQKVVTTRQSREPGRRRGSYLLHQNSFKIRKDTPINDPNEGNEPRKRRGSLLNQNSFKTHKDSPTSVLDGCNELMESGTPIDELTEIINLRSFDATLSKQAVRVGRLDSEVRKQLRAYVADIASMYRENAFHNIEHASHVTMSANKLMNRIVVPDDVDYEQGDTQRKSHLLQVAESVHNSTFGISSDPLAQFAIVFAALIHDVDHSGLTNAQLVTEKADVALKYDGKSVAEQNSVDVAWNLLMEPEYELLRQTIFPTASDRRRFRQLVVSTVLATDIIDQKLQLLRKNRWDKAFHSNADPNSMEEDMNRKATIVIEHIIQASDVAHTMQHWHVYCKWNQNLFFERYRAFVSGHDSVDPSVRWYEEEISFFDNYVIPLANKLKECGVFGVSSDEYLGFAVENRMEWEVKGRDVVDDMLRRAQEAINMESAVDRVRNLPLSG